VLVEYGPSDFNWFHFWQIGSVLSLTTYSFENGTVLFNIRHMLRDRSEMVGVVTSTAFTIGIIYTVFCCLIMFVLPIH